jgi:hypothetical protein
VRNENGKHLLITSLVAVKVREKSFVVTVDPVTQTDFFFACLRLYFLEGPLNGRDQIKVLIAKSERTVVHLRKVKQVQSKVSHQVAVECLARYIFDHLIQKVLCVKPQISHLAEYVLGFLMLG